MLSTDRPEQVADGDTLDEAKPACVALVPLSQQAEWSHKPIVLPPPDPTFVAQLIATAEQMPQTRARRRATVAVALSAYGAGQHRIQGAGLWTRQIT